MKAWRSWATLLACTATALFVVPGADAKPGYIVFQGSHWIELDLEGTHGYSIHIAKRDRSDLEVFVHKGRAFVLYLLRGKRTPGDGIDAELPGIGQIDVEFHPTGKVDKTNGFFPNCKGGDTVTRHGFFQGIIRLRGERGFTRVDETRVRGKIVSEEKEICKRSDGGKPEQDPTEHTTNLSANTKAGARTIGFAASETTSELNPERDWTVFLAFASEKRHGMDIMRSTVSPKGGQVILDDSGVFPLSATVEPPHPFHGTATFQRHRGLRASWTGPLNVSLPGAGRVALAGRRFSARICVDADCHRSARTPAALLAQGSGSQSQAFWDARLSWSK